MQTWFYLLRLAVNRRTQQILTLIVNKFQKEDNWFEAENYFDHLRMLGARSVVKIEVLAERETRSSLFTLDKQHHGMRNWRKIR